ncbi:MAG: SufE family protein [Bacteroidetes bacterium]|nr:SufE family protein [Bacteroidota bacterium]
MQQTIEEIQQEIVEEFEMFHEWQDKYEYLIQLGKELDPMPVNTQTEENKVKGCQSNVWVNAEYTDGKLFFTGDSDALIVKGLVALVLRVFTGNNPDEILNAQPHFIADIGLANHLSPTRSNGLAAMVKQIKFYALAYKTKAGLA